VPTCSSPRLIVHLVLIYCDKNRNRSIRGKNWGSYFFAISPSPILIHDVFCVLVLPGPSLSLSCLRLLVPPIRLVSAAIWQTVIQKAVLDYGVLEEFVYMVTDLMPQLLKARQRAELIFGLRARVRKIFFILYLFYFQPICVLNFIF